MKAILREENGAYLREFALVAEDYDSAVEEVTQMMDNAEHWGFFDKVFTVYDKEAAKDVTINCGARSCMKCQRCYKANPKGVSLMIVNEKLK